MQAFTDSRDKESEDELWLTQHPPVFTLGQAAKDTRFLLEPTIPVVETDRGGQVTYHGPGQIVGYALVDLKRARLSVHEFVGMLEQAMIDTVGEFGVLAQRMEGNPGIYVEGRKIGALGLRVRRRCTYHGISLNVDMDLSPFDSIDPCGIPGMTVTQLADLADGVEFDVVETIFSDVFQRMWESAEVDANSA